MFSDRFGRPWDSGYYGPQQKVKIAIYDPFVDRADGVDLTANVTAFGQRLRPMKLRKTVSSSPASKTEGDVAVICPLISGVMVGKLDLRFTIAECPMRWDDLANISVSITFPQKDPSPLIHIVPGQGDLVAAYLHRSCPGSHGIQPFCIYDVDKQTNNLEKFFFALGTIQPMAKCSARGGKHIIEYEYPRSRAFFFVQGNINATRNLFNQVDPRERHHPTGRAIHSRWCVDIFRRHICPSFRCKRSLFCLGKTTTFRPGDRALVSAPEPREAME
ncbi:hypothetical protein B0H19DRAFT_106836 [Mycena capillaripes]|nr:hypothetical protein B0H19DRAFT_106836 [Mycena capillaripes]